MRYVDEFRDPKKYAQLVAAIRSAASQPWAIMEVCGGQTHGLLRYGIDQQLDGVVRLIHGPGCPVCVTPLEAIDRAIALAQRSELIMASFGDMLRVPGSRESLLTARSRGADVRIVYSPLDAVRIAQSHPDREVVFFAVGFETTAPATALAVLQADRLGLDNFSLLVTHVRVQPAMELLVRDADCPIDGFLAAGHVCTVTGFESYQSFVDDVKLPIVVTGFEPVDLLAGILECVRQLEAGEPTVANQYGRSAAAGGNRHAIEVVEQIYEVCDRRWRGFGSITAGGLRLRGRWQAFDAVRRFPIGGLEVVEPPECRSGEVLSGRIKPTACEQFGSRCTPESPLGAPMVSDEGACAAYFRYARRTHDVRGSEAR